MEQGVFYGEPGFCSVCGSILPLLGDRGGVICRRCKTEFEAQIFSQPEITYIVSFNSVTNLKNEKDKNGEENTDGPIIERRCSKCNNDKMSYATLQLRSADEGQTVFYTCTKCGFKETENS